MSDDVNQDDNNYPAGAREALLFQLLDRRYAWFEDALLRICERSGRTSLGKADLRLLTHLDCGTTHSSELARRLGVSRQAVGKLMKNLVAEGLVQLEIDPERRNMKRIVMTDEGTRWIREAVGELQKIEKALVRRIGGKRVAALRQALEADWGSPVAGASEKKSADDRD